MQENRRYVLKLRKSSWGQLGLFRRLVRSESEKWRKGQSRGRQQFKQLVRKSLKDNLQVFESYIYQQQLLKDSVESSSESNSSLQRRDYFFARQENTDSGDYPGQSGIVRATAQGRYRVSAETIAREKRLLVERKKLASRGRESQVEFQRLASQFGERAENQFVIWDVIGHNELPEYGPNPRAEARPVCLRKARDPEQQFGRGLDSNSQVEMHQEVPRAQTEVRGRRAADRRILKMVKEKFESNDSEISLEISQEQTLDFIEGKTELKFKLKEIFTKVDRQIKAMDKIEERKSKIKKRLF